MVPAFPGICCGSPRLAGPPLMRHPRTTSLLVAFYLLGSAATATAECAWVLWVVSPSDVYERVAADPTQEQCIKYAQGFAFVDAAPATLPAPRSEERRVGKECRSRWSPD